MEPEDGSKNTPRKEQNSSSSGDDELLPVRKRVKTDSLSDDDSMQRDCETYTQETVLTGTSWDAAEASENVGGNGDQQSVESVVTDGNNNDFSATDQSTQELQLDIENVGENVDQQSVETVVTDDNNIDLQLDINDSVPDDTNTDSAVNLDSTLQPDTRYVIPQNSLYRPSITELITKHNVSSSANETDNKPDKPNTANDISANIDQIRQDFIRSWDRILAADDLIPEPELSTLNPNVPENMCQYLENLGARNSTNEALAELIPRVTDEVYNLQQRDDSEFQSFEPEPMPFSDFPNDPLDLLESSEHSVAVEEFDFDVQHWNRIQQAFVIPEQIPDFGELFTYNGVLIPNCFGNDSPNENAVEYQSLTGVPNELAHIYSTIIREAAVNQHSNVSPARRVPSENPGLPNYVVPDSNSVQPNYNADLYRSLLGIPSPFARTENTPNQQSAMSELDLSRSVEPERVPPQSFRSLPVVEPNTAEFDMQITKLESTSETRATELETNPTGMETNPVELYATPFEFEINPVELKPSSSSMATSTIELYSTPDDFEINPAELSTNPREMLTTTTEMEPNSNEMETTPADLYSTPADFQPIPVDMETNNVVYSTLENFETNPAELPTISSEMEINTIELYSTPLDFTPNPADMETNTDEMETNSRRLATQPIEMEINPIACEMNPAELSTSSVELASSSVVSNQEDNEASTPSGSDAYDGSAQIVIVPRINHFKPLKIYMMNPNVAGNPPNAPNAPTEESTSSENADSAQEVTNDEQEVDGVEAQNDLATQEMNRFEAEMSTIDTEINGIIREADRFEEQAAHFAEAASEFQEVESFFRQISEIFEFAAMSLQEAVDDFESTPLLEASDVVNDLDPLLEGIAVEDDNVPDQEVPDVEENASSDSDSSRE